MLFALKQFFLHFAFYTDLKVDLIRASLKIKNYALYLSYNIPEMCDVTLTFNMHDKVHLLLFIKTCKWLDPQIFIMLLLWLQIT